MSDREFTPGPWVAYPNPMRDDGWFVSTVARKETGSKVITDDGRVVPYTVPEKGITYFQINGEANARAISALPELHECARILAGLLDPRNGGRSTPTEEQCNFARATLAKARGEQ